MHAKPQHHKPYGLLKQFLIPEQPWNSISMDFMENLPKSSGYDTILVIVDHLTKQSIFILTYNTLTSAQLAQLFVIHIFSKHGIPSHITSNRSLEFVSSFFRTLGKVLNRNLHFTSSYHPKGDGQMERTNQTLEQYLHIYCNYQHSNWSDLKILIMYFMDIIELKSNVFIKQHWIVCV
jgi:IS30 family transposase